MARLVNSGYSNRFVTPRTLAVNGGPSQQFRVDLLVPAAAVDSRADVDIRATVFETRPDAPTRRAPLPVTIDLSRWEGQTLRLRIATADNQGPMRAGVDNIRLIPLEPHWRARSIAAALPRMALDSRGLRLARPSQHRG